MYVCKRTFIDRFIWYYACACIGIFTSRFFVMNSLIFSFSCRVRGTDMVLALFSSLSDVGGESSPTSSLSLAALGSAQQTSADNAYCSMHVYITKRAARAYSVRYYKQHACCRLIESAVAPAGHTRCGSLVPYSQFLLQFSLLCLDLPFFRTHTKHLNALGACIYYTVQLCASQVQSHTRGFAHSSTQLHSVVRTHIHTYIYVHD
jgi:hypothetical protein